MAWTTYPGLALPECVKCCGGCVIECISQTFDGSVTMAEKHMIAEDDPPSWDVTSEIVGNVLTTTGTIDVGADPGDIIAGTGTFAFPVDILGYVVSASGAAPWDMAGTAPAYWRTTFAFDILTNSVWGLPVAVGWTAIGSYNTGVGFGYDNIQFGISVAADEGTECVANITANTESHDGEHVVGGEIVPTGASYDVLADDTFTATLVRFRLRISGLTIDADCTATVGVYRRLHGTSDPWVWYEDVEINFTATATTDFTNYVDVLHSSPTDNRNDGYDYRPMTCQVVCAGECSTDPGSPYQNGLAQGAACEECDDGSGGCPGGDPGTDEQCWLDGYDAGIGIPMSEAFTNGYAQGFACEPCDDGSGGCPADNPCTELWLLGWSFGFSDAECP